MGRVEEIAKEVDDGRQSGQQQKTAAAAESGRVGRPVRSTDVHKVHKSFRGRPAGSTGRAQSAQVIPRSTGRVDREA